MTKSVLIIDDASTFRNVMRFALEPAGYHVIEAADGAQALAAIEALGEGSLSAIVCDVHMPVMDGLTFVSHVKQLPAHRFVPVVMLTTEGRAEHTARGRALGLRAWMIKPFQPSRLLDVLDRILV